MYFLTNVNLIVPVVCAVAVIVIAIAVICVLRSGRRDYPKGKAKSIVFVLQVHWPRPSERIPRRRRRASRVCRSGLTWTSSCL